MSLTRQLPPRPHRLYRHFPQPQNHDAQEPLPSGPCIETCHRQETGGFRGLLKTFLLNNCMQGLKHVIKQTSLFALFADFPKVRTFAMCFS